MSKARELLKTEITKMESRGSVEEALTNESIDNYVGTLLKTVVEENENLHRSVEYWKEQVTSLGITKDNERLFQLVVALASNDSVILDGLGLVRQAQTILTAFNEEVGK